MNNTELKPCPFCGIGECNMKEFVEKLIERLEEEFEPNKECFECEDDYNYTEKRYTKMLDIVNQLAEEYNNDFCEWKLDGVYLMCQHKTELFISCLEEEKYRYNYCPICGKKIKVVE